KTGTGKTLTTKYTSQQMQEVAKQKNIPLKIIFVNCKLKKIADTEYRLLSYILKEYGKEIPFTGIPTDDVYARFYEILDEKPHQLLLILDEIDELIKKAGDEFLYNITRIELKKTKICIVGISNDLNFTDRLDARVRSSMSEEEIIFPPYDADQIFQILQERAKQAFQEGAIDDATIAKCAAYAAREHGDARKALDLLRVAGELAERQEQKKVTTEHIDQAEEKIEKDKIIDIVKNQPLQYKLVLYSALSTARNKSTSTGEIYSIYESLCKRTNNRPLTQRRISDIIADFDIQGLIKATVISKGRYGRTREIEISIPPILTAKLKDSISKDINLT
ncbi:MAG TPA: AAA family ATPase, partial [Candidatus Woesearchaeota archaeon]|nr:AAA family ATPase [Candidatus Woesearchaeota archaeon]